MGTTLPHNLSEAPGPAHGLRRIAQTSPDRLVINTAIAASSGASTTIIPTRLLVLLESRHVSDLVGCRTAKSAARERLITSLMKATASALAQAGEQLDRPSIPAVRSSPPAIRSPCQSTTRKDAA